MKQLNMKFSEKHLTTTDFLVSGENFDLMLDENYEMLKTVPFPTELHKYYQSENYLSHKDKPKDLMSLLYYLVKKISLQRKVMQLKKYKKKGVLLDIGAGTGEFLLTAQKAGFSVFGTEPNPEARNLANQKNLLLVDSIEKLNNKKFDVITMWHVLEHIPNLKETIIAITELLSEKGVLIIAVPNYKSYDASYYDKFWAGYDVPRHLWHFSKKSISKLFENQLTLLKIRGMPFDSYYVSLLSEKYKSGKSFSLKALYRGFLSNKKAKKSGEWSSLIYIFKKN